MGHGNPLSHRYHHEKSQSPTLCLIRSQLDTEILRNPCPINTVLYPLPYSPNGTWEFLTDSLSHQYHLVSIVPLILQSRNPLSHQCHLVSTASSILYNILLMGLWTPKEFLSHQYHLVSIVPPVLQHGYPNMELDK